MPLDPDKLFNWPFEDIHHTYGEKDTMLYALGLGLGQSQTDPGELKYVYEDGLRALPSMSVILAYPGFWVRHPASGVDWKRYLHGEQSIEMHGQIPVAGAVRGRTRVTDVVDKGRDKGALIVTERCICDTSTGKRLATVRSTGFARGDGGFSESPGTTPPQPPLPEGPPDTTMKVPIPAQAALIYRLSGDMNPLHADPRIAKSAGFDRPILHGLCTFGVTCHAIIRQHMDNDPGRLRTMSARFSSPVYPGETLAVETWAGQTWQRGSEISFRVRADERDVVVLSNGRAGFDAQPIETEA